MLDRLSADCPHALIDASEHEVGLPAGQMGNSEVGHMNIGAGRVLLQDLPRIDRALEDGSFAEAPALRGFIERLQESGGTAHLLGLLSPGGVHSHQRHMAAYARTLAAAGLPVALHAFLDGRDTPPRSALQAIAQFQSEAPDAPIRTVTGRYYAMDRDGRWERVERAYRAWSRATVWQPAMRSQRCNRATTSRSATSSSSRASSATTRAWPTATAS